MPCVCVCPAQLTGLLLLQVPEMSQKPFRVVAKPAKRGSLGASGPIVIKPADGVAHAILLRFRTNDWSAPLASAPSDRSGVAQASPSLLPLCAGSGRWAEATPLGPCAACVWRPPSARRRC